MLNDTTANGHLASLNFVNKVYAYVGAFVFVFIYYFFFLKFRLRLAENSKVFWNNLSIYTCICISQVRSITYELYTLYFVLDL